MKYNKYKFRCHYQGSLVSVPKPLTDKQQETLSAYRDRAKGIGKPLTVKQEEEWHSLEAKYQDSKTYKLSDTAKNLCAEIVFNENHGRKKVVTSKYFDKGLGVEKKSRDILSNILNIRLTNDPERKENDWVIGSRDIASKNIIIDIKSTFDFNTFNKHLLDNKHEYYFRQLDSYMDLWNIKDSILAYVLVDTPEKLIDDEIRRYDWRNDILNFEGNIRDENIEDVKQIINEHLFTRKGLEDYCLQSQNVHIEWFDDFVEIPIEGRVHLVNHQYEKERIEQRNECLTLCREFMETVKPMNNITINNLKL
jgi:hypothetical protein